MLTGLQHAHKGLAYLVFFAALVNLVLALSASRSPAALSRFIRWSHLALIWAGRVNIVIGMVFIGMLNSSDPDNFGFSLVGLWWIWLSLLLWGPIEVMAKRFVLPDLQYMADGAPPRKLLTGVVVQLVCITVVFGIMSAH